MYVHVSVYTHNILFIAVSNEVIMNGILTKLLLVLVSERERKLDCKSSTWLDLGPKFYDGLIYIKYLHDNHL